MMRLPFFTALLFAAAIPAAATAQAPGLPPINVMPAPADSDAIPLGTGSVQGGLPKENWFNFGGPPNVRNVTRATLTPVLPDPAKATGAAVIVAPGGGFMMLSMSSEGWEVARWLADHGIAAFVLKYRLRPSPADNGAFASGLAAAFQRAASGGSETPTPDEAIADGQAALALVRARATQWHVDPKRVGLLGFSAGAMTVLGVTQHATPETMPAFVAPIYPYMSKVEVPAAAPPLFASLAMDDPLVGGKGYGLVEGWRAAGKPAELHVYQSGGHGYGLGRPGTATAGWIDTFYRWLAFNGFLGKTAQ